MEVAAARAASSVTGVPIRVVPGLGGSTTPGRGEIVAVLGLPEARERISGLGAIVVGSSPQEFAEHIRKELALWERVIKAAGIRAD